MLSKYGQELQVALKKIQKEELRARNTLHLTANENILSQTALHFCSSPLGYRYHLCNYDDLQDLTSASHYLIHNLMVRGLPSLFSLEKTARAYACDLFHAQYCDFRPLSGMNAVFCILSLTTQPGDRVYVFSNKSVGHHATISLLKQLGRHVETIPWDFKNHTIDLESFAKKVKRQKPKHLFFDFGTALFPLPLQEVRSIVGKDALMTYDGSHVLGLIAGQQFQNPLTEGCDILIGNTHKTFPGPQKGILLYKKESLGKAIAKQIFTTALSSQHSHHAISLYITLIEMKEFAQDYAKQIVANNHALAQALEKEGFIVYRRVGELPLSHIVAIIGGFPHSHHEACALLHQNGISTNSRTLFHIPSIRIGVQEVTRRGMKEKEMKQIAPLFRRCIIDKDPTVSEAIVNLNNRFTEVHYSFDQEFRNPRKQP